MVELQPNKPGANALLWQVPLYGFAALFVFRGIQAFTQAPILAVPLGLASIWMGLVTLPPVGKLFLRFPLHIHILARVGVALLPIMSVGMMIGGSPLPGEASTGGSANSAGGAVPAGPAQTNYGATARSQANKDDAAIYPAFIKKVLASHLIDPQSAQLSDVMAFKTGEKLTLCGRVNSKNRMGGYAGPTPFIISDAGIFLGDEVTSERVFQECQGIKTTMVTE